MRLHRLEVRNFRGISSLDWQVDGDLLALVGPGDVGKSTVLDAIELALSSRWAVVMTENDFHECDTANPISVTCYVSDIPNSLLSDRRFGLDLRGINPTGLVHDEPENGDVPVLAVRFSVDETYEPRWSVVNDRLPAEGKPISSADRRHFGLTRLGLSPERHLSWSRGSALAQLTEDGDGLGALVAAAAREMRASIRGSSLSAFDDALSTATKAAQQFGVGTAADGLTAQLSADAFDVRIPSLSLHAKNIPLDRSGLGTRRLIALALQHQSVASGGIALIDEVESGLEPHRLRHLLRVLRESLGSQHGQVIVTTHSSTVVEEFSAENLAIIRRSRAPERETHIGRVPRVLQAVIRSNSESVFARKVVVSEGRTEIGVLRGLTSSWSGRRDCPPTHKGVVYADGGGHETCNRALGLHSLGYRCIVVADSDVEIDPDGRLSAAGLTVVRWKDRTSIDERLFFDLPIDRLRDLFEVAIESYGFSSIEDQLVSRIPGAATGGTSIDDLFGHNEEELRRAAGGAAKANSWFKRIDLGEIVGQVVGGCLSEIAAEDLGIGLGAIENWIYDDSA